MVNLSEQRMTVLWLKSGPQFKSLWNKQRSHACHRLPSPGGKCLSRWDSGRWRSRPLPTPDPCFNALNQYFFQSWPKNLFSTQVYLEIAFKCHQKCLWSRAPPTWVSPRLSWRCNGLKSIQIWARKLLFKTHPEQNKTIFKCIEMRVRADIRPTLLFGSHQCKWCDLSSKSVGWNTRNDCNMMTLWDFICDDTHLDWAQMRWYAFGTNSVIASN